MIVDLARTQILADVKETILNSRAAPTVEQTISRDDLLTKAGDMHGDARMADSLKETSAEKGS